VALAVGYAGEPRPVRFLERPNRYLAIVAPLAGGPPFEAHVPNPGRMVELLRPGDTDGWVVPAANTARRTGWDLVTVRHRRTLVSIDSRIANRLVARVLADRTDPRGIWRAEVPIGHHRFDFGLSAPGRPRPRAVIEVKSSNWRIGDTAYFPDAPTTRGTAHVLALARLARSGVDARVLFAVQRADVRAFAIHRGRDRALADVCDRARRSGVRFLARRLRVRPAGVEWGPPLPIRWTRPLGTYKGGALPSPVL
jgi:sugar fermentation stimulation protein A